MASSSQLFFRRRFAAGAAFALIAVSGQAASLTVRVTDAAGLPAQDAVIYAEPASGQHPPHSAKKVEIEQKARKFQPLVTVVQVGTSVSFPNNDTVRHHVYSFSPAKVFDIKLYSGESNPILFDKTGTVVVGCNIHDQMVAYIHIVPTPYFAKTDAAGHAQLEGLQPGKYILKAWHYSMPPAAAAQEQTITVADADVPASFKLNVKAGPAN
jgi:plastocyanin